MLSRYIRVRFQAGLVSIRGNPQCHENVSHICVTYLNQLPVFGSHKFSWYSSENASSLLCTFAGYFLLEFAFRCKAAQTGPLLPAKLIKIGVWRSGLRVTPKIPLELMWRQLMMAWDAPWEILRRVEYKTVHHESLFMKNKIGYPIYEGKRAP